MLLKELRVQNFRNFDDITIKFDEFCTLLGPNNIGKSSIFQALGYIFSSTNYRNIPITKSDFKNPSKPLLIEAVLGDLNSDDIRAFYHDDGIINPKDNTISICFTSSWSSLDQDVDNECYFVRKDLPLDQQRISDFSARYKHYLPFYCLSAERFAQQEIGINKHKDLGKILRVYTSDYLKPLNTLRKEIQNSIEFVNTEWQNWNDFPKTEYDALSSVVDKILSLITDDFSRKLQLLDFGLFHTEINRLEEVWKEYSDPLFTILLKDTEVIFYRYLLVILEKVPILFRRAKTQLALYELRDGMLEEQKFEEMNLGFKEIFEEILPGCELNLNLFSIQDDELISQVSVDMGDLSVLSTGSGFQSIFVIGVKLVRILTQLQNNGNKQIRNFLLAIEEPENHLHPHLQRHLIKYFRSLQTLWGKKGYQLQIVVSTHSPCIVSKYKPEELILLHRDNSRVVSMKWNEDQLGLITSELEPDPSRQGKKYLQLRQFLEFFMERNADVFFCNSVVVVEGQTEEGAVPIWAQKISPPLDFDKYGICFVNSTGDNITYVMKILGSFNIDHSVLFDKADGHRVINLSNGRLYPTRFDEFEDEILISAKLSNLIKASVETSALSTNNRRKEWIKGNIPECQSITNIDELPGYLESGTLSERSFGKVKKQVKSWLESGKSLTLGRMIGICTSEAEIPPVIYQLLTDLRQQHTEKQGATLP